MSRPTRASYRRATVYYPTFRFSVFPAQSVVVPYVTRPAVIYSPAIQFNPASIGQAAGPGEKPEVGGR
jgi:hypothetical protein